MFKANSWTYPVQKSAEIANQTAARSDQKRSTPLLGQCSTLNLQRCFVFIMLVKGKDAKTVPKVTRFHSSQEIGRSLSDSLSPRTPGSVAGEATPGKKEDKYAQLPTWGSKERKKQRKKKCWEKKKSEIDIETAGTAATHPRRSMMGKQVANTPSCWTSTLTKRLHFDNSQTTSGHKRGGGHVRPDSVGDFPLLFRSGYSFQSPEESNGRKTCGCGSKLTRRGKPQVLVHVST